MDIDVFRDHLYRVVQIESPGTAPAYIKQDAATALNQAYQDIWSAPKSDFLTREIVSLATVSGQEEYQLDDAVQEVLGPVTLATTGKPLAPCDSKGEFLSSGPIYLGDSYDVDNATPEIYWIDRRRKVGDSDDEVVDIFLMLAPTPNAAVNLKIDVAKVAPSFTAESFCDASKLPTPHRYHESILLPIARYHMTASHYFSRPEIMPLLERGYVAAMAILGVADPQIYSVDSKSRTAAGTPA